MPLSCCSDTVDHFVCRALKPPMLAGSLHIPAHSWLKPLPVQSWMGHEPVFLVSVNELLRLAPPVPLSQDRSPVGCLPWQVLVCVRQEIMTQFRDGDTVPKTGSNLMEMGGASCLMKIGCWGHGTYMSSSDGQRHHPTSSQIAQASRAPVSTAYSDLLSLSLPAIFNWSYSNLLLLNQLSSFSPLSPFSCCLSWGGWFSPLHVHYQFLLTFGQYLHQSSLGPDTGLEVVSSSRASLFY